MKDTGYDLVNHRVILPTKGTYKYKVTKDRIVIDKPNRVDTVLLSSGPNFLKRLDKLAKNENPRFGLPPGEYYSLKIGDHDTFLSHAKSLEKLMDYGRIKAFNSSNARDYVSLVHVKFKPGFEPRPTPIPDLERTFNPLPTATRKTKARKRAKKTQG